jgi:hypothetical protein
MVEFNHLIILSKEKQKTADFITELLDLPDAVPADGHVPGFFLCITFGNDVTVLIAEAEQHSIGHYAFKVDNSHFEEILAKLNKSKQRYWADVRTQRPFECYEESEKKGFYIIDPSGHGLEVLTQY